MSVINLVFFSLSFVAILSAFLVVIARNQVHSVMWLIVTFFSVAGLFISMGAEFLAMVLMIVYIGAIAVLFLFVVMLLGVDVMQMRKVSWNHLPLAMCLTFVVGLELYFAFYLSIDSASPVTGEYVIPNNDSNTHMIGKALYTDYIVPFLLSGFVLLASMIGSIVLTLQGEPRNIKRQNPIMQLAKERADCVELVDVAPGRGLE